MIIEEFKEFMFKDRRTIKWFYDNKVKGVADIGYSGLTAQLNGYANLSPDIETIIVNYMKENVSKTVNNNTL